MVSSTITEENFRDLIDRRTMMLLGIVDYISQNRSAEKFLTRPLLGELLSQSIQIEELLDAYGAKNNRKWCRFRSIIATIKLFSDVSYELLHIQHSLPAYRLLPIKENFNKATGDAIAFTADTLLQASVQIYNQATHLGLTIPKSAPKDADYADKLPAGRLPRDLATRRVETVSETVTLLATAFLNLADDTELAQMASQTDTEEYGTKISDALSEETLRQLQNRFHNLQSLYDTYVSETDVEDFDKNLSVLRGHISVIFHLLKTATSFAHYYERHISGHIGEELSKAESLVTGKDLLEKLMGYSINYANCYLVCAQRLCQEMLRNYAEIGEIEVHIPQYRGFHVRPSTFVSKIVFHYGSKIEIKLDDESYDAGSTLELFRINEKINAEKRRWLATEIARLQLADQEGEQANMESIVRGAILILAERGKLIIYEHPLELSRDLNTKEGVLLKVVADEIARLQATGKIDIEIDLNITFIGDKRVLVDIKLLAENGYGEDNFGNNIALPKALSYLRH
ncbi:MAG: hypothetical protein KAS75_02265 [Planctomycetes bacterium]|nr:hypothetical protein [Planctomycetota bacterium]